LNHPAGFIRDIRIENNTLEESTGISIFCSSARNLMIRGNLLSESHKQKPDLFGSFFTLESEKRIE